MSRGSSGNEPKGLRKMFQKMLMPDVGIRVSSYLVHTNFITFPPIMNRWVVSFKPHFLYYFLKTQHI